MQTLSPEVVYKMLVAAALRRSTITLAQVLSNANDGIHVSAVTAKMRKQVSDALCACYWMDVRANRLPLSALFVMMEEPEIPGNRLRSLMETQQGRTFESDAQFLEHWRSVRDAIWESYNAKAGE